MSALTQPKKDLLIAVGDDARYYAQGASGLMEEENIRYFPKKEDFIRIKDSLLREGDVILVKASRGMEMEKIVNESSGGLICIII